jgi:hypothetical protein
MDEKQALEQLADGYRREGYTVTLRPGGSAVPPFLASFAPDLIARKNGDNVVVQVKLKEEIGGNEELSHLAGVVNAEPGWRFDLVVLNPKTWPDEVARDAAEPAVAGIEALITEAGQLAAIPMPKAALVAVWAAFEAAMREAARRNGILLERNYPRFVLTTLYSEGLLSHGEYDQLLESLRLRNAVVHGLQTSAIQPGHAQLLVDLAKRLLELKPAPAGS